VQHTSLNINPISFLFWSEEKSLAFILIYRTKKRRHRPQNKKKGLFYNIKKMVSTRKNPMILAIVFNLNERHRHWKIVVEHPRLLLLLNFPGCLETLRKLHGVFVRPCQYFKIVGRPDPMLCTRDRKALETCEPLETNSIMFKIVLKRN
jgi:hypothetical protein